jgi:hypothetical protein
LLDVTVTEEDATPVADVKGGSRPSLGSCSSGAWVFEKNAAVKASKHSAFALRHAAMRVAV